MARGEAPTHWGAYSALQTPNWVDIPSPEIPGFATVCPPPLPNIAGYATDQPIYKVANKFRPIVINEYVHYNTTT